MRAQRRRPDGRHHHRPQPHPVRRDRAAAGLARLHRRARLRHRARPRRRPDLPHRRLARTTRSRPARPRARPSSEPARCDALVRGVPGPARAARPLPPQPRGDAHAARLARPRRPRGRCSASSSSRSTSSTTASIHPLATGLSADIAEVHAYHLMPRGRRARRGAVALDLARRGLDARAGGRHRRLGDRRRDGRRRSRWAWSSPTRSPTSACAMPPMRAPTCTRRRASAATAGPSSRQSWIAARGRSAPLRGRRPALGVTGALVGMSFSQAARPAARSARPPHRAARPPSERGRSSSRRIRSRRDASRPC